jgi:RNA ligase
MNYKFPHITHIDDVLPAIEGRDEFKISRKDDYLVVNYHVNFHDTFPEVKGEDAELLALRRECRGIIFSAATGKILRRVFHKFFNVQEREEMLISKIDFSQPHIVLAKLDGSMISPFVSQGKIRFGTKMGVTDVSAPAEAFAYRHAGIMALAEHCLKNGLTPIFEWTSPLQRIVIDYKESNLTLTAVRDMVTGTYLTYPAMQNLANQYGVDIVSAYESIKDIDAFIEHTRALKDEEGYVFRFGTGHMGKIKADDYCAAHSVKERLTWEKDVIAMILNEKADDVKAFMTEEDRKMVEQFEEALYARLHDTAERLKWMVIEAKDNLNGSKKKFAIEVVNIHPFVMERSLLFKMFDKGEDQAFQIVKEYILSQTGSQSKVDAIRSMIGGLNWWDFRTAGSVDLDA